MRVAVLGLGSAGRRHAAHLQALGHEAVGFDPAGGGAATAGAAISAADAVIVASPNTEHAAQAAEAIDAGRPVLVEKPLAVEPIEAAAVVELAAQRGVVGAVAMNLRFHAGVVALRDLLQSGELGEIRLARCSFGFDLRRWRPGSDYRTSYSARRELGGGILLDSIHELDYLLWLLGPAESVVADVARLSDLEIDVEDTVLAAIRFASGARAAVDLNFHEPAYRRGCILVGERAVAEWDWHADEVIVRRADDVRRVSLSGGLADSYRAELEDFIAAASGGPPPRTTLADGLDAVRLADAVRRSAANGIRVMVAPNSPSAAAGNP